MLVENTTRNKRFFQVWISRFTFYIDLWPGLFIDSPS
jgi:hypothetical protein